MPKLTKNITLVNSPSHPNIEVVGDLAIQVYVPYSKDEVTVKINPNIVEYKEKVSENVSRLSVSYDTKETKTLKFDFKDNNLQRVQIGKASFEIKLLQIGKVNEDGQDFPTFEFLIMEI